MQSLAKMLIGFMLTIGATSITFDFYRMIKKEALLKASKGQSSLSKFTQSMTGSKNAW